MSCSGTCSQSNPVIHQPATAIGRTLPSPSEWFGAELGDWLVRLVELQRRWRRYEELRDLSDAQLRDVGLTREQIGGGFISLVRRGWPGQARP